MLLKVVIIFTALWTTAMCQNFHYPESATKSNRPIQQGVKSQQQYPSTAQVTLQPDTRYQTNGPSTGDNNRPSYPSTSDNRRSNYPSTIANNPTTTVLNNIPYSELNGFRQDESNAFDRSDKTISQGVVQMTLQMDSAIAPEGKLHGDEDNVVFSPVSIAMALALVMLGSSGRTLTEVSRILGLEYEAGTAINRDVIHEKFGALLSRFDNAAGTGMNGTPPHTTIATAVFVQTGYPIKDKFLRVSNNAYKSDIVPLDFAGNSAYAGQTINRWVDFRTQGRIKGFLKEAPSPGTKVLLASALYFNGEWEHPFPLETTKIRPFYVSETVNGVPGETIQVTMMANAVELPYFNDATLGCQIVTLPYKGNQIAMHVVLPNERGYQGLHNLREQLTVSNFESLISNTRKTSTIISIPRMKLSSSISLKSTLESMGLRSLFIPGLSDLRELSPGSPNNDFNDFIVFSNRFGENETIANGTVRRRRQNNYESSSRNPGLYADDVIHKVEIEVTETGTIASAATAISISRSGSHRTVRMDRPFLFFIRHETTKLILFWGAVARPT